jgi:diguanylate cyclase (GGDEF)-like protein
MGARASVGAAGAAEGGFLGVRTRRPSTLGSLRPRLARRLPASAAPVIGATATVVLVGGLIGATPVRLVGVAGVAAVATGVLLHRRVIDRGALDPVLVIGLGIAVLALTQGGLSGLSGVTWASAAALIAYPPLARGLMRLFAARLSGRESDVLVQAGLAALAAGVTLSVLTAGLTAGNGKTTSAHLLLPIVVTSLDVGLLTIAVRLALLPGDLITAYRYLVLAIAYLLGAHLSMVMNLVWGPQHLGPLLTLLGVGAFVLFGAAFLHPSVKRLEDPIDGDPPTFSPGHVILVVIAMVLGPAAVGLHVVRHEAISRTTAVGAALVALMLATYMGSLLWDRAAAEHRGQHDELTGLPNRALLHDRISRALAHARRSGSPVAVMFIDLDRFKWVNDTFGHGAGDTLLRLVGERLQSTLRDEDTVARLAGDEFAVLLPHVSGPDGVVTVAERMRDLFAVPLEVGGERIPMTASIGVAMYPYDGEEPEQLIARADAAMYRAKEAGRNTFEIYSPQLASRAQERLALESSLITAMERGELVLHYQPIFDVVSARVVGAEALVRWQHPEQGLIMPGGFVPIAEQSDLVVTLGSTVLSTACRQMAEWSRSGMPPLSISVNVSARQLRHGIADLVAANLRTTGVDPSRLVLELTETAAVDDVDRVASTLSEVGNMGVRWAIDDFGTGYCSLMYLSRLPVDSLKIDKSFVQSSAPADESIVSAIIAMGHGLGLTVVAEGVERIDQLKLLSAKGCDRVQGFLFGRPLPPLEFEQFVRRQYAESRTLARA